MELKDNNNKFQMILLGRDVNKIEKIFACGAEKVNFWSTAL